MNKIFAAGGLVFNEKNELLMIFRRGKWDLPKGKADEDESPEITAIREVQEETGIRKITLHHFTGTTFHEYFDTYQQEQVIKETAWFAMRASSFEKLIPQTEEDIFEIKWISMDDLETYLENTYENIKQIIAVEMESNT